MLTFRSCARLVHLAAWALVAFASSSTGAVPSTVGPWRVDRLSVIRHDGQDERVALTLAEDIRAVAAAGDATLFVATAHAVWTVSSHGEAPHVSWRANDDEPAILALGLDPGRGALWVVRTADALRLDVFEGFRQTLRIVTREPLASAVDVEQGTLWLLGDGALTSIDAEGTVGTVVDVSPDVVRIGMSLRIESATARLDGADRALAIDLSTGRIETVAEAARIDGHPTVSPGISARVDGNDPEIVVVLAIHAACTPTPCFGDDGYAARTRVTAALEGRDVTAHLSLADVDRWHLQLTPDDVRTSGTLVVSAVDPYGNRTTRAVAIGSLLRERAKANALPTVRITAPASATTAVAPATFTIAATAADTDGTIAKVEFYRNGVLLGADVSAPYTWSWTGVAAGTYSLTARAYDNAGGVATSAAVGVTVKANVPPTVALVSPPSGAGFVAPATITLSANAADTDGTIARVDFLRAGTTLVGSVTTKPYTYTWTNVPAGTYSFTAKATDDKGAATTSVAVSAKVNNPPSVSIAAPLTGAHVVFPANVTVKANAGDTDGSVAKVEFHGDGTLLGSDTASPYSAVWSSPAVGTHTLTARATDNLGAVRTSTPVTFTVDVNKPPAVTLTSPATSARRFTGTPLVLAATATDPDGTIARVEFLFGAAVVALDSAAPYTATLTVPDGATTITAVAVDNLGARTASAPVVVTGVVNQPPAVTLDGPPDGTGYLTASVADIPLRATASDADGTIVRVRLVAATYSIDGTEGPPITVATLMTPPYAATWRAVAPVADPVYGYRVWAEADDDAGATSRSAPAMVFVSSTSPWYADIVDPPATPPLVLEAPATIVVAGRVGYVYSNPDADPLRRVELLGDGTVVGTSTAPTGAGGEHVFVWRDVAVGSHQLELRVVDTLGLTATSGSVRVDIVAPDRPPVVTVQSPTPLQTIVGDVNGGSIPIALSSTDPDGTVARLVAVTEGAFSAGIPPPAGSVTWTGIPNGVHVVTGRAVDDRGREAESPPVFVEVVPSRPPPVVTITAPAPGGVFVPRQPITFTAEAGGPDPIARVDYVAGPNNILLGSAAAPPYRFVWTPGPGGTTLRAVAYTTTGAASASVALPLDILSNLPPVAMLMDPRSGKEYTPGETVRVEAVAGDSDGTVASVTFAANGASFAMDATDPYVATWTAGAPGVYALTAMATDNQGATTVSKPANVTVVAAIAAATITAPASGAALAVGIPAAITARAVMPGKSVTSIELHVDGVNSSGANFPYATSVGNAVLTWARPTVGAHVLTVRAVASDGSSLMSPAVPVTVDDYAMTLADPVAGQVFLLPSAIRIQAAPTAGGAAIARVEFLADGAVIGAQTAPPYSMVWRGAGVGAHTVGAQATDTSGRIVSATVPVSVVSAPDVSFAAGLDNSTVADDVATITGVARLPRNAAVVIAGRRASLDPAGNIRIEGLPLVPGPNVLPVTVNTADGPPVKRTITINSSGSAPFAVDLSPQDGFTPLVGTLTIRNRAQVPFARIEVDASDNGSVDVTLTSLVDDEARIDYTVNGVGTFVVKVTVFDAGNTVIYQARRQMRVFDRAELAGAVLGAYYTMVERLAVSDATGALRLFTGDAQVRYADIFATLAADLPAVAADLRRLVDGVIGDDIAELTIARDTPQGLALFMVYLIRGRDGVWRIDSL